jgi:hypothetical protein
MTKLDEKPERPNASVNDVSSGIVNDTTIELDPELERRTLRKFDKFLLPPLACILLLAYLDRSNLYCGPQPVPQHCRRLC